MSRLFVKREQFDLFYTITEPSDGSSNAPWVCLSHCFGSNHHYWDCHLPALESYRVLRYDTRGHGQSERPRGPWTLEQMAIDVVDLLDSLAIDRVHFVGVSMGGMIGQTLALKHSDRLNTVTLANSPCQYSEAQVALWRERAQLVTDKGIEVVRQALMARWFTDEAATNQSPGYTFIDEVFQTFSPESFASATEAICQINTTDRLSEITMPTLLFGSLDDPGVPVEVSQMMADSIKSAQLHWLTPSRHLATLEQVDSFNETLRRFLLHHADNQNGIA